MSADPQNMAEAGDFKVEAYGTVTNPPTDPDHSDEQDD